MWHKKFCITIGKWTIDNLFYHQYLFWTSICEVYFRSSTHIILISIKLWLWIISLWNVWYAKTIYFCLDEKDYHFWIMCFQYISLKWLFNLHRNEIPARNLFVTRKVIPVGIIKYVKTINHVTFTIFIINRFLN